MSAQPGTRIVFVDRDGTLIREPADEQVDSYEKLELVPEVIASLRALRDAGYQFVMVSNQDGLGTASFPTERFQGPHRLLLQILASQGIVFREVLIDPHRPDQDAPTRKPGIGMVMHYLRDRDIDLDHSAVVGDRETDVAFARNLGVRAFLLGNGCDWPAVVRALTEGPRHATVARRTRETCIEVELDLDRAEAPRIDTGLPFFDHMLEQLGKHGGFALVLRCRGDLQVDEHHTVEDSALALGQALRQALGDKRGIERYGFVLPMDESLAQAVLDLSGRAWFRFEGVFPRERVGDLPTELVPHFFHSLCEAAGINLHLSVRGGNAHHMVEACFKAVARALRQAIARSGTVLPSTKGTL
ncbi:MAG TPA: bifunctional histidinol-phosphatase/imidazoleglycerol-phosphate dehydratase HisB [Xanthomonadaceae bacterium]|nr:bifunctional histidinol-phosphatase/imidazoleglycerol-phosphate dehydratase HisB [Xanthomonadaceae bacterium]